MARKSKAKSQKKSGKAKVSGSELASAKVVEQASEDLAGQATETVSEQEVATREVVVPDPGPASGIVAESGASIDGEGQPDKDKSGQVGTAPTPAETDKPCPEPLPEAENHPVRKNGIDLGKGNEREQKKNPVAENGNSVKPKQAIQDDESAETGKKATVAGSGYVSRTVCAFLTVFALILGVFIGTLIPQWQVSKHGDGADSPAKSETSGQPAPVSPESAVNVSKANGKADSAPPMPKELAQKMAELEKAVVASPTDAKLWTSLGNLYFDSGQSRKAIDAYEKSLTLAPGNPDIMTDLGIMYRETGDYDKAVAQFRAASAILPSHQNALFNEGVVLYYDMGQKDAAIVAWQKLLKVNPQAKGPDGQSVSEMIKHLH